MKVHGIARFVLPFLSLAWLLSGFTLLAQIQAVDTGPGPRLVSHDEGTTTAARLLDLDISARIHGFLAETTLTCTFFNERDLEIEGEFLVPLPEGATVSGYALDVNGQLVDGVMVEKHQARIAFERESRRKVDPGIAEWVDGNVFRTRVYPIPEFGTRTIRLRYVHPLYLKEQRLYYRLPLEGYPRLGRFALDLSIEGFPAKPTLTRDPFDGLHLQALADGKGYRIHKVFERFQPKKELVVGCPVGSDPLISLAEIGPNEYAFAAAVSPGLTSARTIDLAPKRVAIYWDGSLSVTEAGQARAQAFLEAFMRGMPTVEQVDLVVFRDVHEPVRSFRRRGHRGFADLFAALKRIEQDGGTDFFGLTPVPEADLGLLVSDGRDTLNGPGQPLFDHPLYALKTERLGQNETMRYLAEESGGAFIDLSATKTEAALAQMKRRPFRLVKAELPDGRIGEVLPVPTDGLENRALVTGTLTGSHPTRLVLRYGFGTSAERQIELDLKPETATQDGFAGQIWAQRQMREWMVFPDRNREKIVALSQRFGQVSPFTTAMVFEDLSQYLEYQVEPPAMLADMRAQYRASLKETKHEFDEQVAEYREDVFDSYEYVQEHRSDEYPLETLKPEKRFDWRAALEAAQAFIDAGDEEVGDTEDAESPSSTPSPGSRKSADTFPVVAMVPSDKPSVRGTLRDARGQPVAGVQVTVTPVSGESQGKPVTLTTDEQGAYEATGLALGRYTLSFEKEEYHNASKQPFTLVGDRTFRCDAHMWKIPYYEQIKMTFETKEHVEITGTVLAKDGTTLPGAQLKITEKGQDPGTATRTISSDADGRFRFSGSSAKTYHIEVDHRSFPGAIPTSIDYSDESTIKIIMDWTLHLEAMAAVSGSDQLMQAVVETIVSNESGDEGGSTVTLVPWDAKVSYVAELAALTPDRRYAGYLALRQKHGRSPAFFLDCARSFFREGEPVLGRRILSNLLELGLEDAQSMRVTAGVLVEQGLLEDAEGLYLRLIELRPEWPQVKREYALVHASMADQALERGERAMAQRHFRLALQAMGEAIWTPWGDVPDHMALLYLEDERFEGFSTLAALEYQGIRQAASRALGSATSLEPFAKLATGLQGRAEGDLMVLLHWDDPTADMDLWVVEASGELANWENEETRIGGLMTADLTEGLGPEGYVLFRAMPGTYKVFVQYYGSNNTALTGHATCTVTVVRDFGRATERRETQTIRLEHADELREVLDVEIPAVERSPKGS
ncbi:Carboxypeptidase regulatory-like domain-containing protein [Sulfidibacter corallicola]|uniref:Carboxypeptidase regulatory-like domain-containing protein n=1 Tax=Sulfidibacter corallicola TaxID=2818388 RepID=A0A8A4THZ7_SULCO|nr:carboxypeptidase regulatory-like domain-containing protein [Sulfidibacter corallicola]QTD48782.1 carboxypeptidase regulatory-like domain-containing protein [Sulfidibacter corallicola]